MIYGKYKYFSHKFNNLEERHAELFMIVSIREGGGGGGGVSRFNEVNIMVTDALTSAPMILTM